jgi:hypothetical protein
VSLHRRDDSEALPGTERLIYLKDMAISNIKRLSRTGKRKAGVREWVGDNFPPPEDMRTFAHKIPIAIVGLIPHGIEKFARLTSRSGPVTEDWPGPSREDRR